jgi:hypothetical protein
MKTQSADTSNKAEAVLIDLIRKKTSAQKIEQVRSLSRTVIQMSRRAIARAKNTNDKAEIDLAFIELHYGAELAERVRLYLRKRGS